MPLISLATGANSIKELSVVLKEPVLDEAGAVVTDGILLNYGLFLQTIIDFFIIALCVFIFIRVLAKSAEKTKVPQNTVELTSEDDIKFMGLLLEKLEDDDDVMNVYHNWENAN
jgi:large-conductance mechanosensitive channel